MRIDDLVADVVQACLPVSSLSPMRRRVPIRRREQSSIAKERICFQGFWACGPKTPAQRRISRLRARASASAAPSAAPQRVGLGDADALRVRPSRRARRPCGSRASRTPRAAARPARRARRRPVSPISPNAAVASLQRARSAPPRRSRARSPRSAPGSSIRNAAGDVDEHVRRRERKPRVARQHRDDHRQALRVDPRADPPRHREIGRRDERLDLEQQRPRSLERAGDRGADLAVDRAAEDLGRVRHADETGAGHLEDAQLVGRAEPVLGRSQDAVRVVALALELEHTVDQVLEHARAGDRTVLRHVTDEYHRHAVLLARPAAGVRPPRAPGRPSPVPSRARSTTASAPSRSRRRRAARARASRRSSRATVSARISTAGSPAEALGAQLDLCGRLLARHEQRAALARDRARAPSAASVDFPTPGSPPIRTSDAGTIPPPRTRSSSVRPVGIRVASSTSTSSRRSGAAQCPSRHATSFPRGRKRFLDERPERAAPRALAEPARRGLTALGARELDGRLAHTRILGMGSDGTVSRLLCRLLPVVVATGHGHPGAARRAAQRPSDWSRRRRGRRAASPRARSSRKACSSSARPSPRRRHGRRTPSTLIQPSVSSPPRSGRAITIPASSSPSSARNRSSDRTSPKRPVPPLLVAEPLVARAGRRTSPPAPRRRCGRPPPAGTCGRRCPRATRARRGSEARSASIRNECRTTSVAARPEQFGELACPPRPRTP